MLIALNAFVNSFSMHRNFFRRLDPDTDLVSPNPEHRDGDVFANCESLLRPSHQN